MSDWHRLLRSRTSAAAPQRTTKKYRWPEIRSHASPHDGWIVLHSKVYDISPYLAYHPGGATILQRVLGKDVTQLYHKFHSWVNADGCVEHSMRVVLLLLLLL